MKLSTLLKHVKEHPGISHKRDIAMVSATLPMPPAGWHPNGDDAAAIPTSEGFNLLAMEGLLNDFVENDPWFAGWCGVMVNISDIAAMGGYPQAVVNAMWNQDYDNAELILKGMIAAAQCYKVPIIGGHTNMRANQPQLAVSILGHAKKLLSSFAAKPGQILVATMDHRGSFRKPYLNWNSATGAPAERLRGDIALLPYIAEKGLAFAAKDISQAGLIGTALMLLESSGVGAHINLENVPKPETVEWKDWLCCFPSFGYLLTTNSDSLPELLALFHHRDICAAAIGKIKAEPQLSISHEGEECLFRDMAISPLTGFTLGMETQHARN